MTKRVCVSVDFYDPEGFYHNGAAYEDIPYANNYTYSSSAVSTVYGNDYVNEEYGLFAFVSTHSIYAYDDRYCDLNGNPIVFQMSQEIVID